MNTEAISQPLKAAVDQGIVRGAAYAIIGADVHEEHYLGWCDDSREHPVVSHLDYDLASLTKVVATATRIFQLLGERTIELEDPVGSFFETSFPDVTVADLLLHDSGLPADLTDVWQYESAADVWQAVKDSQLVYPTGSEARYSDLNFIILGKIIEKATGNPLAVEIHKHVLKPLGMHDSGYCLGNEPFRDRNWFVPTEMTQKRGQVWGSVHDETAWQLQGCAGHAGLFASLSDLENFAQMYLNDGRFHDQEIIPKQIAVRLPELDHFERTLAWIRWTPNRKNLWHTGFTGPGLGIDLDRRRALIILTNAVYPKRGNEAWQAARRAAAAAFFGGKYREKQA